MSTRTAAAKLAGAVGSYLKVSSPADKGALSKLGGPEGWGERFGMLYEKGLGARLPNMGRMLGSAPSGSGGGSGGSSSGGVSVVANFNSLVP